MLTEPDKSALGGDDPVLQMRLAVAELAGEDREGWTGSALSERLKELLEVRERLDAELLRLTGQWDRERAWEIDGALTPRAWLRHRAPISDREAGRLVKSARLVDQHDAVSSALADGEISTAHVDTIGNGVSKAREPLLAEHREVLVDQAKRLPVADFATVMRRWAALADDQLAKDDFKQKWDRRHLHASLGLDGWVTGDFYLDPAAGAALIAALDHEAPPDPEDTPDGPRTLSQRRADALVDIVNRHLNGDEVAGNPPHLNVIVDAASASGHNPELAAARCELEGVGPITRSVMEQLGCDAKLTRIVTAGPSVVLDMGRATRTATAAQRRALAIRDQHCRFPGCGRQPQWCDAHHVAGWVESLGETNLGNLILLCRRHHTLIHNSRWHINLNPDGEFEFTHPARGP